MLAGDSGPVERRVSLELQGDSRTLTYNLPTLWQHALPRKLYTEHFASFLNRLLHNCSDIMYIYIYLALCADHAKKDCNPLGTDGQLNISHSDISEYRTQKQQ